MIDPRPVSEPRCRRSFRGRGPCPWPGLIPFVLETNVNGPVLARSEQVIAVVEPLPEVSRWKDRGHTKMGQAGEPGGRRVVAQEPVGIEAPRWLIEPVAGVRI